VGGIVGAHVAVWAALNPDQPLPTFVDAVAEAKAGELAAKVAAARPPKRREHAAAPGLVRNDLRDFTAPEHDERTPEELADSAFEEVHRLAAAATAEAMRAHHVGGEGRRAGAQEGAAEAVDRAKRAKEVEKARKKALRDAGARDPSDPRYADAVAEADAKIAAAFGDAPGEYGTSTVASAAMRSPPREELSAAATLARGGGPDPATIQAVKDMLARSVQRQHEATHTNAQARIANVWREARVRDEAKRAGGAGAGGRDPPSGASSARDMYASSSDAVGPPRPVRAPVEVYHGLRNPDGERAAIDDDPLAVRRSVRGGRIELTSAAAGSRPTITRPRAADVFVRRAPEPEPRLNARVTERQEERAARAKAKEAAAADVSKRYFGSEGFKRGDGGGGGGGGGGDRGKGPKTLQRRDGK
jgi:hypothetical protein